MTTPAPHLRDSLARRFNLGRLALRLYYQPRAWVARILKAGVKTSAQLWLAEAAMQRAASRMPPYPTMRAPEGATEVCYLTGHAYWHQTIFCVHSLLLHSPHPLKLIFIDDGTLRLDESETLLRAVPSARLVSPAETERRLAERLPRDRYPLIWHYRKIKPLFKKITDVFGVTGDWRLLLDSDMLFFRPPAELLAWLGQPAQPCYMIDVVTAYGYNRQLMEKLTGRPLAELINIGIFGFSGRHIDWDRLETWIETLTTAEGLPYNFTQGLSAMLLAGHPCLILPAREYLLLPDEAQTRQPTAILHHYVAASKRWYFHHGWQHFLPAQLPAWAQETRPAQPGVPQP